MLTSVLVANYFILQVDRLPNVTRSCLVQSYECVHTESEEDETEADKGREERRDLL
jgi:hypothetical protein